MSSDNLSRKGARSAKSGILLCDLRDFAWKFRCFNPRLILATTFMLLLVACTRPDPGAANRAVANKMFDAFNKHDWEGMANCYSDTASFLDPAFGTEYVSKTRQQTVAKYNEVTQLFPDIHDEVTELYTSGDKVIAEFIATGSMSDSVKFRIPIAIVLTIKDGLIVKDATYYDPPDQGN